MNFYVSNRAKNNVSACGSPTPRLTPGVGLKQRFTPKYHSIPL
jgi:hypothetical protein